MAYVLGHFKKLMEKGIKSPFWYQKKFEIHAYSHLKEWAIYRCSFEPISRCQKPCNCVLGGALLLCYFYIFVQFGQNLQFSFPNFFKIIYLKVSGTKKKGETGGKIFHSKVYSPDGHTDGRSQELLAARAQTLRGCQCHRQWLDLLLWQNTSPQFPHS